MSYVDLNPIRANLAASLEESDVTSIQQRLGLPAVAGSEDRTATEAMEGTETGDSEPLAGDPPAPQGEEASAGKGSHGEREPRHPELVAFSAPGVFSEEDALPLTLGDYVELLESTGAAVSETGPDTVLPEGTVRILQRVGIRGEHWLQAVLDYRRRFLTMVGGVHAIDVYCARTDRQQAKGSAWKGQVFRDCA